MTVLAVSLLLLAGAAPVDVARAQEGAGAADSAAHQGPGPGSAPGDSLRILDVPYVAQTEDLCGGAAAAMVMRYWRPASPGADPGSFAPLVDTVAAGIRTGDLVEELGARGWRARPFRGDLPTVGRHLEAGRPVIALIRVRPGRFHYVVLVARRGDPGGGAVLLHDPARAPFRWMDRSEFLRRWRPADRWSLLLLPPGGQATGDEAPGDEARGEPGVSAETPVPDPTAPGEASPAGDECGGLVRAGVERARGGELDRAGTLLRRALRRCPDSAAPHREMAGLQFREERWEDAVRHAREALARDPDDAQAARVLGAGRFMVGEESGALAAWNRLDRPRVSSVRIYGLHRTRWRAVRPRIPVRRGDLLTPGRLSLSRRRAGSVPAFDRVRVRYRPEPGGDVTLEAAVVERPRLPDGPLDVLAQGLRGLPDRELRVRSSNLLGAGERWDAGWRWWEGRPAFRLALSTPKAFGLPGLWRLSGLREEESFASPPAAPGAPPGSDADDGGAAPAGAGADPAAARLTRLRADLGVRRWVSGRLRLGAGLALDRWAGGQAHLSPRASLELRGAGDRLAVRTEGELWAGLARSELFGRARMGAAWRSDPDPRRWDWTARAGVRGVAAEAPRSLWPGAGTGDARPALLRAHPLLEDGVITGPAFGRVLAHGGAELRSWILRAGPVRAGPAVFVDAARAWDPGVPGARSGWWVDGGLGLRLAPGGAGAGHLRVDLAVGITEGAGAVSVGWRTPWPSWR